MPWGLAKDMSPNFPLIPCTQPPIKMNISRESKEVEITLNGLTRLVPIARVVGGCWWGRAAIVCRFKTGDKLHTLNNPIVDEVKPGEFAFRRGLSLRRRHARRTGGQAMTTTTTPSRSLGKGRL
jgi:hypothetical protein